MDKGLIRNSESPHSSVAFMVRNHTEKKREKARILINYKKINCNNVFDDYYIDDILVFSKTIEHHKDDGLAIADNALTMVFFLLRRSAFFQIRN